jgi:hypothetical protein
MTHRDRTASLRGSISHSPLLLHARGTTTKAKTLSHLTLQTGHVRNSPRHEVHDDVIAALSPIVISGGGPIAKTDWTLRMVQGAAVGSCGFELHWKNWWVCSCYLAWTKRGDVAMRNVVPQLSSIPFGKLGSVPWLTAVLMPGAANAPFSTLMEAGDLERCIAWTVLETMGCEVAQ